MVLHTLRVFTYNLYTPFRQDGHRLFLRIVYSSSHMWALTPAGLFPQQTPVKHVNWGSSKKRTCPVWNVAMINTPVCFPLSTTQSVSEITHYSVCTGFYDGFSIYLHVKSIIACYTMRLKYSSFVFSNSFLFQFSFPFSAICWFPKWVWKCSLQFLLASVLILVYLNIKI